jgi:hypothetical protein
MVAKGGSAHINVVVGPDSIKKTFLVEFTGQSQRNHVQRVIECRKILRQFRNV